MSAAWAGFDVRSLNLEEIGGYLVCLGFSCLMIGQRKRKYFTDSFFQVKRFLPHSAMTSPIFFLGLIGEEGIGREKVGF